MTALAALVSAATAIDRGSSYGEAGFFATVAKM